MSGVCIGTALKSSLGLEINVLQIHELSYLPNDLENVGLYSNDLVTMGESSSSMSGVAFSMHLAKETLCLDNIAKIMNLNSPKWPTVLNRAREYCIYRILVHLAQVCKLNYVRFKIHPERGFQIR